RADAALGLTIHDDELSAADPVVGDVHRLALGSPVTGRWLRRHGHRQLGSEPRHSIRPSGYSAIGTGWRGKRCRYADAPRCATESAASMGRVGPRLWADQQRVVHGDERAL